MNAKRISPNAFRFAVGSVLAATLLSGCAGTRAAPRAEASASQAQVALSRGQAGKAVNLAEAAVLAAPRDANTRALLGHSYLKAGRFASAATAFNDAMSLGDNSTRTALSLALAYTAAGRNSDAVALLDDWRDSIPASDLGLAYSLAGETGRGVAILADALRGGDATPKMRQNLAYAYALDGRWREARIMMSQDVPADQVDDRISQWAASAQPEAFQTRVAGLLSVPVRSDPGQPAQLALANSPSAEQLAAESGALRPEPKVAAAEQELPASDGTPATPAVAMASYVPPAPAAAPAAVPTYEQPVQAAPVRAAYVAQPVVQPVAPRQARTVAPSRVAYRAPAAAPVAAAPRAVAGTHMVQLGSFSSQQGARRAWGIYAAKNPELKNTRMTITQAVVRGKNYWRVAAAGLNGASATGLCSTVKGRGGACFAYAAVPARATNPAAPARGVAGPMNARRR